jgi:hypothetical protein
VPANHILQNFLSAENSPEWKWLLKAAFHQAERNFSLSCDFSGGTN